VRRIHIRGEPYEVKDTATKTFREFIQLTHDWHGPRSNVAPGAAIPAVRMTKDGDDVERSPSSGG
jgi:hypothetical protein